MRRVVVAKLELDIERERMRLEREKMLTSAAVDAAASERDMVNSERKSELDMQTAEAQAKAAQKPNGAGAHDVGG